MNSIQFTSSCLLVQQLKGENLVDLPVVNSRKDCEELQKGFSKLGEWAEKMVDVPQM